MPNSTEATLNFDYMFTAVAGTTYSYQLLGETGLSIANVDHIVNIAVPPAVLNKVLCYGSNWYLQTGSTGPGATGSAGTTYYQPEPAVALLLTTVLGPYLDDLTAGLTGVTSGGTYYSDLSNYITGTSPQVPNLVKKFQDISGFTYLNNGADDGTTGIVVDYLSQIPVEAIHSVNFSPVDTLPLSEVTGDLLSTNSQGQTMAHSGLSGAIQSLFEQAVGAGMVTTGNTAGTDLSLANSWPELSNVVPVKVVDLDTSIAAGGSTGDFKVFGATFTAGQSLGIFVQYNLQKVRQYQLSALANLPTTYTATGSWEKVASSATPGGSQLSVIGSVLYVHQSSNSGAQTTFLNGLQGAIETAGPSGLLVSIGNLSARFTSSLLVGSVYSFTATTAVFGLVDMNSYALSYSANGPVAGAAQVSTLTFGGETFDATLGNAAEVSVPHPVVYQIVFTATSPV
jgi:hypothetical protein